LLKPLCVGLALLLFSPCGISAAIAQQTDAETAALGQRQMTEAERATWRTGCTIPAPSDSIDFGNTTVRVTTFDDLYFLKVIDWNGAVTPDGQADNFLLHPDLPFGGIGARDICNQAILLEVSPKSSDRRSSVALFLRSSVDLSTDYPSSITQIQEHEQLVKIPAGRYLVVPKKHDASDSGLIAALKELQDVASTLARFSETRHGALGFWMRNTYFVPLVN